MAEGAFDRIIANLALLFSSTACVTYVRSTKIGDTDLMTSWTCGATAAEYFVLATTTGGDSTSACMFSPFKNLGGDFLYIVPVDHSEH